MKTLRQYYVLRAVGSLANQLLQFLLPVVIYSVTRSALWTGVALIVEWGPRLVSLVLAGAIVDRFGVRTVYVSSDLLRLVAAAATVVVMATDRGAERWGLLAIAVVSGACFEQSFVAGEKAVRLLAPLATMHRSQSVLGAIDQATLVAAPVLGAVMLFAGPTLTTSFVTLAFAVDLMLARRLPAHSMTEDEAGILRSVIDGIRWVAASPIMRDVVVLTMLINLMLGVILSGAPVMLSHYHHSGSYLGMVYTVGGIASIAVLGAAGPMIGRMGLLGVGVLTQLTACAAFAVAGGAHNVGVFTTMVVILLCAESLFTVFMRTVRAHVVPPDAFGRVVGVIMLLNFAPMPLAGVIVGSSVWAGSLGVVVAVTGALCGVISLVVLGHLLTRPRPGNWPQRRGVPAPREANASQVTPAPLPIEADDPRCREFMEAARAAPGILVASANHALEPLSSDPVTEKIPIVPNTARPYKSDTMASHHRQRLPGAGDPNTLSWRVNLAAAYWDAGRVAEAIPLLEQTLAEQERLLGADHPRTLAWRVNLANAYRDAGPAAEAIPLHERTLAACEAGAPPPGETGEPDGRHPPPDRPIRATGSRPRRRGLLRPRWLAALAALILIAAGTGTWALARGGSGFHTHGTAMPSMPAKKPSASALMNALILANKSADAKGDLPPSTCTQQGATKVTCTAPAPGIEHSRLPDLPVAGGPVRRVRRSGRDTEHWPVPGEFPGLQHPSDFRRGRLEPPVPAPQDLFGRADELGNGAGRPGRGPGVLQLQLRPGEHGMDSGRWSSPGLRGRPGA